jgi:hypothetical protein
MFLFRPSNNNQRYAFVPLLDQSDNDAFDDGDDENGGKIIRWSSDQTVVSGFLFQRANIYVMNMIRKGFEEMNRNLIVYSQVTMHDR